VGDAELIEIVPASPPHDPAQTTVEVDWYLFTDRTGNQWLLEGTYAGAVRPAAPAGDL
jgi:hypothetical protein